MTDEEYEFMMAVLDSSFAYAVVGLRCYENGWIDDFGIVTPTGEKALEEYNNREKLFRQLLRHSFP